MERGLDGVASVWRRLKRNSVLTKLFRPLPFVLFPGSSSWSREGSVEREGRRGSDEACYLGLQELGRAFQPHARQDGDWNMG